MIDLKRSSMKTDIQSLTSGMVTKSKKTDKIEVKSRLFAPQKEYS